MCIPSRNPIPNHSGFSIPGKMLSNTSLNVSCNSTHPSAKLSAICGANSRINPTAGAKYTICLFSFKSSPLPFSLIAPITNVNNNASSSSSIECWSRCCIICWNFWVIVVVVVAVLGSVRDCVPEERRPFAFDPFVVCSSVLPEEAPLPPPSRCVDTPVFMPLHTYCTITHSLPFTDEHPPSVPPSSTS